MNTDLSTYQAAVLQSRAHRALKICLTAALRKYDLTMMQWSIIGLIAESETGSTRISDLARALDTSLAFITTSVNVLEKKGFVVRISHDHDSRAKLVSLNPDFASQIMAIEAVVKRAQLSTIYQNLSPNELTLYFKILQAISGTF